MNPLSILVSAVLSLLPLGNALQVTPGSACAALCLDDTEGDSSDPNASNTEPSDITCTDDDYESTTRGVKFKNCVNCLQNSNATSDTENDISWFLYNVRYSLDVCLFGFPGNASKPVSSPCDIKYACQPLQQALESGNLSSTAPQYDYCSADGDFLDNVHLSTCIQCFAASPNQAYMSNFVTALQAGCEQKPAAGTLIGLSGALFTDSLVNITEPPDTSPGNESFNILTTGAIVGIAVGGALLLFGGLALFWVHHRRQKRMYRDVTHSWSHPRTGIDAVTPPLPGAYSAADKGPPPPMSDYELRSQRMYKGSNKEYYDMLEKEIQLQRPNYALNPNHPQSGPESVLPTHAAYVPRAHSRQSSYPPPPQLPKVYKRDSYTSQVYLSATMDTHSLNHAPPPPSLSVSNSSAARDASLYGRSSNSLPSHSRDSSVGSRGPSPDRRPLLYPTQEPGSTALRPPPPPPPPPQKSKVPALSFPSVPRLRIPKKYIPPSITVQGATPIEHSEAPIQSQGDISIGLDISNPMTTHEPRFGGNHWERRGQSPSLQPVVEQTATDRRPQPWILSEVEVRSGKSVLY
ncbi:hypothetical protein GGR57DRAFT_493251 [Xylariaceae sp. FL1272]|nr:hypothetical protein GGR57DRAFT_493251 [Xylariaceae sp. FL1272]